MYKAVHVRDSYVETMYEYLNKPDDVLKVSSNELFFIQFKSTSLKLKNSQRGLEGYVTKFVAISGEVYMVLIFSFPSLCTF